MILGLKIYFISTFVVITRVVFIQVMVLRERFDSFRFVQGFSIKDKFFV